MSLWPKGYAESIYREREVHLATDRRLQQALDALGAAEAREAALREALTSLASSFAGYASCAEVEAETNRYLQRVVAEALEVEENR